MVNDTVAIVIALGAVGVIVAWWIYSLYQMRRNVIRQGKILDNAHWRPFTPKDDRYKPHIPQPPFAYRVYYQFLDLVFHDPGDRDTVHRGRDSQQPGEGGG